MPTSLPRVSVKTILYLFLLHTPLCIHSNPEMNTVFPVFVVALASSDWNRPGGLHSASNPGLSFQNSSLMISQCKSATVVGGFPFFFSFFNFLSIFVIGLGSHSVVDRATGGVESSVDGSPSSVGSSGPYVGVRYAEKRWR